MVYRTILSLILIVSLSGCSLWPYKRDFDCPIPDGLKCQSLHEVATLADQGAFEQASKSSDLSKKIN